MKIYTNGLFGQFYSGYTNYPKNIALKFMGIEYSYSNLLNTSLKFNKLISSKLLSNKSIGILGPKNEYSYQAILGILGSGNSYVPMHVSYPAARINFILNDAEIDLIFVFSKQMKTIEELDKLTNRKIFVCVLDKEKVKDKNYEFNNIELIQFPDEVKTDEFELSELKDSEVAYILYTSGSTGNPKGVPITHKNAISYLDNISKIIEIKPTDITSQTFELIFDLSVHDLFLTWRNGACLIPFGKMDLMNPIKTVKENSITVWFSVPALIMYLSSKEMLVDNYLDTIRLSLFCGEPLPVSATEKWSKCVCRNDIYNIYGPTECTIAITYYQYKNIEEVSNLDVVPIGEIFDGHDMLIRNLATNEYSSNIGDEGELLLAGDQVAMGYVKNPEQTSKAFKEVNGRIFYHTGDVVRLDDKTGLHYLDRIDNQVKINGHRIELNEVNNALVKVTGKDLSITVAVKNTDSVDVLMAFITDECEMEKAEIINGLKNILPRYMMPAHIIFTSEFPYTTNGKISRKDLGIRGKEFLKNEFNS